MTFFPATWAATSTLDGGNPRSSSTDGTRSPTLSVVLAGAPKSADLSETVVRRFFYRDALSVCARARARARISSYKDAGANAEPIASARTSRFIIVDVVVSMN